MCVCAAFLNMLCSLKWGIYIFFGFWQFVAIFFVYFLVPETRGVPIEEVFQLSLSALFFRVLLGPIQCFMFTCFVHVFCVLHSLVVTLW